LEKDKEDMTVPFDEGSQVMHVVGRHAVYAADAGSLLRGVPGDRIQLRERSTMPGTRQCGLLTWARKLWRCCEPARGAAEAVLIAKGTIRAA
jgi:hypothetical protein